MKGKNVLFLIIVSAFLIFGDQIYVCNVTATPTPTPKPTATRSPTTAKSPTPTPLTKQGKARETAKEEVGELESKLVGLEDSPAVVALRNKIADLKSSLEKSTEPLLAPSESDVFNEKKQEVNQEITRLKPPNTDYDWIWFLLKWLAIILLTVLLVGGVAWGFVYLRRNKVRERSEIRAAFSDLKNRNSIFNQKLEELTKGITGLNQQVAQQNADITRLKQNQTNQTSDYPPPPPVAAIPKEQPRFPVSVDDYIGKVGPGATAVKYEYKEGMLVSDTTNEGGLLIVQDEGRLYLIPSFGFFQTKSDYTNYFERFYTCAKPMGGNVWIRQPATVNQVTGGWQMATQGELEIR